MTASFRIPLSLILAAAAIAACDANKESHLRTTAVTTASDVIARQAAAPSTPLSADSFASAGGTVRGDNAGVALMKDARFSAASERTATRGAIVANAPAASTSTPEDVVPGSMLVRVGEASLQVDSLQVGISRIRDVARRTGAVIANTSMEGGGEQSRSATLQLRIPSEHFEEAVSGLSPIGKLESVNVNVQDVGEEFVDVQARMANAHRLEERLIDLLARRTGKLSDVLTVEHELARVREEIERYEGRMRYLRTRASISTLSISIHEPLPIIADRPGSHPIRDAFAQSWHNLVGFTAGAIALTGVIIPIGIIVGVMLFLGRRFLQTHGLRLPEKASGAERA